jgi:hypothetical protein
MCGRESTSNKENDEGIPVAKSKLYDESENLLGVFGL